MADDVDKGMLLLERHHVPQEAVLFVLSLVKAARRALLSPRGTRLRRRWPCWTSGWKTPRKGRPCESYAGASLAGPGSGGLILACLTGDKFATDRILTRAVEADLDCLFFAFTMANLAGRSWPMCAAARRRR